MIVARSLIVEADGGSRGNPGPAAYGAVVRDALTGLVLVELADGIGTASNNVAEYRGAIAGLEWVRDNAPDATVEVRLDSKLVVEQMSGRWKIKHPDMRDLALQLRAVLPVGQVSYTWVPRTANAQADALANEALDLVAAGRPALITRFGASGDLLPDAEDVVGAAEQEHAVSVLTAAPRPANRMVGWTDLGDPTVLLLARHGATAYSLQRRFSGRGGVDVPLAPLGEAQAQALASEVAARRTIDAIVTSPLLRAQQTAHIVAAAVGLPVSVEEGLAECDFGEWDGHTFAEVQRDWPALLDEWLASPEVAPPDGESFAACNRRIDAARRAVIDAHRGARVLVVAHVTPIKLMVTQALDCGLHGLFRMELPPCSVSTLAWFPDGNASMFSFAEATHLVDVAAPPGT